MEECESEIHFLFFQFYQQSGGPVYVFLYIMIKVKCVRREEFRHCGTTTVLFHLKWHLNLVVSQTERLQKFGFSNGVFQRPSRCGLWLHRSQSRWLSTVTTAIFIHTLACSYLELLKPLITEPYRRALIINLHFLCLFLLCFLGVDYEKGDLI